MIINYKINKNTPNDLLAATNIELNVHCNYQVRTFKSYILYIISDYWDYDKEHQKQFMNIIMKNLGHFIISFSCK